MNEEKYFNNWEIQDYYYKFIEVLDKGDAEYQKAIGGKTQIRQFNEESCLLKRLREYINEHLRFTSRPEVPRGIPVLSGCKGNKAQNPRLWWL